MADVGTKVCTKCKIERPLSHFHANKGTRDNKHPWCKDCANSWQRVNRKRPNNPEQRKYQNLKSKYGITAEDYERILESQGGVCAICCNRMSKPCLDHCHVTGLARGILCQGCNIKLPAVENKAYLSAAIRYLEEYTT